MAVNTNIPSFEARLPKLAATTSTDTASSFMERVMAGHTVTEANDDLAGAVFVSDYNATDYKPHPLLKSVVKWPFEMKRELKHALAELSVVTISYVAEIVEIA